MIVVSNSSPLIILALAGQFDLLREFYGTVLIPNEVYEEVTIAGDGLPGSTEVREASWIKTLRAPIEPSEALVGACKGLGDGERSAIYLASATNANLVLIDEAKARRVAKRVGMSVAGSLALLERGARLGMVADLRACYLHLLDGGIYLNRSLLNESLARSGLDKLKD